MSVTDSTLQETAPRPVLTGKRVWICDRTTEDGVRSGRLIHRGSDGRLLVAWDDDDSTALVAAGSMVLSA